MKTRKVPPGIAAQIAALGLDAGGRGALTGTPIGHGLGVLGTMLEFPDPGGVAPRPRCTAQMRVATRPDRGW